MPTVSPIPEQRKTRKKKGQPAPSTTHPTPQPKVLGDVSITGNGEYGGPFPSMLDLVRERLQDTPELVKSQSKDPKLSEIVKDLVSGGTGGDYVPDDITYCGILPLALHQG